MIDLNWASFKLGLFVNWDYRTFDRSLRSHPVDRLIARLFLRQNLNAMGAIWPVLQG